MWIDETETSPMRMGYSSTMASTSRKHRGNEMAKRLMAQRRDESSPVSSLSELMMLSDDDMFERSKKTSSTLYMQNDIWETAEGDLPTTDKQVDGNIQSLRSTSITSSSGRRRKGIDFSRLPNDLGMGAFDLSSLPTDTSPVVPKEISTKKSATGGVKDWFVKANKSRDLICSGTPPRSNGSLPLASSTTSARKRGKRASLTSVRESKDFKPSDLENVFHMSLMLDDERPTKFLANTMVDKRRRNSATHAPVADAGSGASRQRRVSFNATSA